MGVQVKMSATPMRVLGGNVLRRVALLMDVQQRGLLQSEQQDGRQRDRQ